MKCYMGTKSLVSGQFSRYPRLHHSSPPSSTHAGQGAALGCSPESTVQPPHPQLSSVPAMGAQMVTVLSLQIK